MWGEGWKGSLLPQSIPHITAVQLSPETRYWIVYTPVKRMKLSEGVAERKGRGECLIAPPLPGLVDCRKTEVKGDTAGWGSRNIRESIIYKCTHGRARLVVGRQSPSTVPYNCFSFSRGFDDGLGRFIIFNYRFYPRPSHRIFLWKNEPFTFSITLHLYLCGSNEVSRGVYT